MKQPKLRFGSGKDEKEFHKTLRERVNHFFELEGRRKSAPVKFWSKFTVIMALYLVPYILAMTVFVDEPVAYFLMFLAMGGASVGVGFNIVHDANHGSVSHKNKVNRLVGWVSYLLGVDRNIWQAEHNIGHHTFTNIDGHDNDIAVPGFLRVSPNRRKMWIHRFQHLYAWGIYGFITFRWATFGDFMRYPSVNLKLKKENPTQYWLGFGKLTLLKLLYHGYIWIIPVFALGVPWQLAIGSFIALHFLAGVLFGTLIQMAHIMPDCEFPLPDDEAQMEHQWAVHQLHTTCNFGTRSRIFCWLMGGLNFQIEHHLFPNVHHSYFPKISRIVEQTAREFGVPYRSYNNILRALSLHIRHLKNLGAAA